MSDTVDRDALRNRILTSLPPTELDGVLPHLDHVHLQRGQVIYRPGDKVRRVYFIEDGLVALIKSMHDGRAAMVGWRGVSSVTVPQVLFSMPTISVECVVHIPTDAYAADVVTLRNLIQDHPTLHTLLRNYSRYSVEQLVLNSACNRLHSLEQRYARLLMTGYDNVSSESFELTQEALAVTLGVQRSRISVVAGLFQRSKLIEYRHGRIRILDPAALKALACACYKTDRWHLDGVFAAGPEEA